MTMGMKQNMNDDYNKSEIKQQVKEVSKQQINS
jgi:hypothetical protein